MLTMTNQRFYTRLALFFAVLFAAFCLWQSPGIVTGNLTTAEIDHYLTLADQQLNLPDADKKRINSRARGTKRRGGAGLGD